METGRAIAYDGLLRAARLAASMAGASGAEVDDVADEAMARLLLQDGLVNNPKAWVRRTATRLTVQAQTRRRIQTRDVLADLSPLERNLVVAQRAGYSARELGHRLGATEQAVNEQLAEANRKVRRFSRRLADAGL